MMSLNLFLSFSCFSLILHKCTCCLWSVLMMFQFIHVLLSDSVVLSFIDFIVFCICLCRHTNQCVGVVVIFRLHVAKCVGQSI